MSAPSYNGGFVIAMKGNDCVVIAADRWLSARGQSVDLAISRTFEIGPKLYCGMPGSPQEKRRWLRFRTSVLEFMERQRLKPTLFGSVASNFLYEHRYELAFVEPIVAGLHPVRNELCLCDINMRVHVENYVVSGPCKEQIRAASEALWEPNMSPEQLFEAVSRVFAIACRKDTASEWGGVAHIVERGNVTTKTLKTRMD